MRNLIPKDKTDRERYYIVSGFVILILSVVAKIAGMKTDWFFIGLITGIFSVTVGVLKLYNDMPTAMNDVEERLEALENAGKSEKKD